jgi:hypothetical protein
MLADAEQDVDDLLYNKFSSSDGKRDTPVLETQATFYDVERYRPKLHNQDLQD